MNNKFINENDFINNFNFSKQLGQNFLIDDSALQDIANGAEIQENDLR